MLKDVTPEERLDGAQQIFRKLGLIVGIISYASAIIIYDFKWGTIPVFDLRFLPLFVLVLTGSDVIAMLLWVPLATWVGRMSFSETVEAIANPNENPRPVERFLEGWWRNEIALNTFYVMFRVTICVGSYCLFGPKLGIL
jgi:hypothetical protein